jgi:hypothetical protein
MSLKFLVVQQTNLLSELYLITCVEKCLAKPVNVLALEQEWNRQMVHLDYILESRIHQVISQDSLGLLAVPRDSEHTFQT